MADYGLLGPMNEEPEDAGEPTTRPSYSGQGSLLTASYAHQVFGSARQGRILRGEEEPTPTSKVEAASTGVFQPSDEVGSLFAQAAQHEALARATYTEQDFDPAALFAATMPHAEFPTEEAPEGFTVRDGVNFMFGEDMAILGIKWDQDGFSWKMDTMQEQWSEHPVMSTIAAAGLVATAVVPFVGVLRKSAKVGKIAQWGVTKYVDEPTKLARAMDAPKGLLNVRDKAKAIKTGMMDSSLLKYGDDWHALADDMLDQVDEGYYALSGGKTVNPYWEQSVVDKVRQIADPEERLAALGGPKALKQALLNKDHLIRYNRLRKVVESGEGTQWQKMRYQLQKRYSNTYFNLGETVNKAFITRLDDFYTHGQFDKLFRYSPGEEHWDDLYKYLNDALPEERLAELPSKVRHQFEHLGSRWESLQSRMWKTGFIDDETYRSIGRRHIPALNVNTPDDVLDVTDSVIDLTVKGQKAPKMTSVTLLKRQKGKQEIIEAAERGKLITNPDILIQTGYIRDSLLLNNYEFVRDLALNAGDNLVSPLSSYAIKPEAFHRLSDAAKANFISLDSLPGHGVTTRIRRMVAKKLNIDPKDIDELPYISREVFDQFFNPEDGAFKMANQAAEFLGIATAIHKTAVTALNPPTHFANLGGNLGFFMPMAGVNPVAPTTINDMRDFTKVFKGIAKRRMNKVDDVDDIFKSREVMEEIFQEAGVNPKLAMKINGKIDHEVDLIDELMNPAVRQMIEEQSFEQVEGFNKLEALIPIMEQKGGVAAALLADAFGKASKAINKGIPVGGGRRVGKNSLHIMSSAYLAEDMVPKFAAYLAKRRQGLNVDSAVLEIGRRFPQYKTVGKSIRGLRRFALPWVTFPAEAMRIMKNNIMDKPLAMLPWLHSPQIAQGLLAVTGGGPATPEEAQAAKQAAPFWASSPNTVVTDPQFQGGVVGGGTGAFTGYVAGGLMGGPLGAAVGAGIGAAAGAVTGYLGTKGEEDLRAWTLDFLPHSSLMPTTDNPYAEPTDMRGVMDLSPLEPFAILMPIYDTMTGKSSFGKEIPVEGLSDAVAKSAAGLFGMMSPPWVQKYGMKTGQPGGNLYSMSDVSLMGMGGLAGAAAGAALAGPAGAAIGAAAGGAGLATFDPTRLKEDLGLQINASTGERGNPVYDVLMNSFTGLGKNWRITPEQRAFNEKLRDNHLKELRTYLKKQMTQAAHSEDMDAFNAAIGKYHRTYIQQYDDPVTAQSKFTDGMDRLLGEIHSHPLLRRFSLEDLQKRLMNASTFAAETRGKFADSLVEAYHQELIARAIKGAATGNSIGYDVDVDLDNLEPLPLFETTTTKKRRRKKKPTGLFDSPSLL